MGYASISLFRSLTNQTKNVLSDAVLRSIIPIADRLTMRMISTRVNLEKLDGKIDGSNKDFRTRFAPICDTTLKNVTTVDDCDTADFTASTDAVDDILTGKLVFGDSSISMGKSGTTEAFTSYTKTESATIDGTGKRLKVTVFIKDVQELAVNNAFEIRIGNDVSNYFNITLNRDQLKNGLNEININLLDMGQEGTPAIATLDYIFIAFNVPANADTIAAGNLKMDWWRLEDIDSPDSSDVDVFYATNDDTTGFREFGSKQTVTSIQDQDGIIVMTTAPTTTTAEAGVFANYAYVSRGMDWNLINAASCYLVAHIASFIIAGTAPNYTNIQDSFARRDLAEAPEEWARLALSLIYQAIGEEGGIGFRRVETRDLT